ncbi:hypothetical protein F2Q70_00044735 [Brassica cretica]|uniref:Uncharacterized protein n=1 Tax=Brassica cretica TaxID=69181 RepID=A0A8S9KH08_BRACR|nr:hypothetical protein F2Q70_00044735 [Brassica cretica]
MHNLAHTWESDFPTLEEYQSDGGFLDNTNQSDGSCKYSHEQEKCNQERSQSDHCVSSDEIAVNSDDLIALDEEGGVNHGTLSAPLDTDEALSVEFKLTMRIKLQLKKQNRDTFKMFKKSTSPVPSFYNTGSRPMTHNKSEPSKIAPSGPRHTTSASVTNREVTRVGYRHGFQEGQMIGNRKQSVTNDTDVQKGNVDGPDLKDTTVSADTYGYRIICKYA